VGLLDVLLGKELQKIMATQSELAAQLTAIGVQLGKVASESSATLAKVAELEAALASAGNVTPELQAAFDALKSQVQLVDDLVPDAP
jgi:hypothetical protein